MAQKSNGQNNEKVIYKGLSFDKEKEVQEFIFINDQGKSIIETGPNFGKRHVEAIFYFLAVFISYIMRINLSLTIVAMTTANSSTNIDIPTFDWTNRNIILSSFFWGYIVPQVMAGWLMTRYGPKWFLIGTIAIGSFVGYLIPPLAVYLGSTAVIVCRVIQGFCQGFLIPSIPTFMSRWVPLSEKGRIGTFIYAACTIGTVFGMLITGSISASTYGWPMVFHFISTLGILWCIVYSICGCNSPAESTSITPEEKAYIERTSVIVGKKMMKTPWKQMSTSIPIIAYVLTSTANNFGFWILLTQIPTYMNKILMFDLKSNGFLSSLPYLLNYVLSMILSSVSDYLTNKNIISTSVCRKIFITIGMVCPAISLIVLGQCSKEHITLGVISLILSIGLNGSIVCSININNVDLTPNFAGIIQGFNNAFANIFGLIAPLVVEVIVTDENNPEHWKKIFYLASGVYVLGCIIFNIIGSAEVQPWNDDDDDKNKDDKS